MDTRRLRRATAIAAVTAMAIGFTTPGATQVATHAEHAAEVGQLRLDNGRKWEPDQPLREGMSRLRKAVEPQLAPARTGELGPAQYAGLADRIEEGVGYIVANCKLEPEADEVLHIILGEVVTGTEAMRGKSRENIPQQGLEQVARALNAYASHFDDADFKPIRLTH